MADAPAALDLAQARGLFTTLHWNECFEALKAADAQEPLGGDDLTLLGDVAYLIGHDEEAATAYARAYQRFAASRPEAALAPLRRSQQIWQELELPHPCAQVRLLIGRCLRALDDEASASLEFEAARECFARLGALPDLADVDNLTGGPGPVAGSGHAGGLTDREVQVIRLVAAGHTNRAIAGKLCLSEKTVARHLSNIYAKLNLPSRAAATALYRHTPMTTD
jgi:DNA-binding CsgD family transcriptional regulator